MAINFPGPYTLRLFYQTTYGTVPLDHMQELNFDVASPPTPGDIFANIICNLTGGGTANMAAVTASWVSILDNLFHTASAFDHAEIWKYEAGTFEASFVSTYTVGTNGLSSSATPPAGQAIYTFRTTEGGIMKVSLMEASIPQDFPKAYAALSADEKAVVDAVTDGTFPWLARDTSRPFSFIRRYGGQNEALFKKRFRAS